MSSGIGEKFLLAPGWKKKGTSSSIKRGDKRNKLEKITGQLLCFTLSAECQGFAVIKIVKAQELVLTKN